jgi:hypothetical protein
MPKPSDTLAAEERSVLSEVVTRCLADIDGIAERFLIDVQDLRETAVASMELLLRMVGGLPVPERLARMSDALGHRRAGQGVPLESLLRAVRMDFRILWTEMLARVPAASLSDFTQDAVRVWEAVEFHVTRVHAGYMDELASMAHEKEQQRAFLLSRLLSSDGRDPQLLGQVARALGVSPQGSFVVAVGAESARKEFRAGVAQAQAEEYLHERDGALILILEDRRPPSGRVGPAVPAWLTRLRCFVAPVAESLAEVPTMVRVALESVAVLDLAAPGHQTIRQAWGPVAAHPGRGGGPSRGDRPRLRQHRVGVAGGAAAVLPPEHGAQPAGPRAPAHRVRPGGPRRCRHTHDGIAVPDATAAVGGSVQPVTPRRRSLLPTGSRARTATTAPRSTGTGRGPRSAG